MRFPFAAAFAVVWTLFVAGICTSSMLEPSPVPDGMGKAAGELIFVTFAGGIWIAGLAAIALVTGIIGGKK